jgi:hypothetical protein
MEIAIIRLKNIKYLFIVEKLREITATLHGHHQEISGKFVICRQLSSLQPLPCHFPEIIKTNSY